MQNTHAPERRGALASRRRQDHDAILRLGGRLGPVRFGEVLDTNMSRDELISALRWAVHTAPALRARAISFNGDPARRAEPRPGAD